ncbi:uncharacterized WD repeat-containing protein all2124 (plasmid) [Arthrobacter sp. Hiyo8]|nr:uncharacterized WD repeat-containing protein all2124 [Arthrobacter sp. Hiyo8]
MELGRSTTIERPKAGAPRRDAQSGMCHGAGWNNHDRYLWPRGYRTCVDPTGRVSLHDPLPGPGGMSAAACAALPNRTAVAVTGGADGTVGLWNLEHRIPIGDRLPGHSGGVTAVACATRPDWTPIAVTGGADGTVRMWNLIDQAPLSDPLPAHPGGVTAVACATLQDGTPIAVTGGADGTVRLWNLIDQAPLGDQLPAHPAGSPPWHARHCKTGHPSPSPGRRRHRAALEPGRSSPVR